MKTPQELREILALADTNQIASLFNEGYKFSDVGFRRITKNQDVILRIENDNSKKAPIEYLVISLSEEFMQLFEGRVEVCIGRDSNGLNSLMFSKSQKPEPFRKVGKRHFLKISTANIPTIGNHVQVIYEMKNGFIGENKVEITRPKTKQ